MDRKEAGGYAASKSVDLQLIQDYEVSGCKLRDLLEDCRNQDLLISFCDKTVEADWVMAMYKMIVKRLNSELKVKQKAGIQRALERKAKGNGEYGRPRTVLPQDFEEQLKFRIMNKESLSHYCEELHMKKSTFYKWVKIIRESWME